MKLYNKILTSIAIATLTLTSCDKSFDEINTDPNRPLDVPTYGLLTNVQRNIASYYNNSWSGQRITGLPSQHWSQSPYTDEDRYDYNSRSSSIDTYFRQTYSQIEILNQIIALNEGIPNATLAVPYGDPAVQIGSAVILRAHLLEQCAEVFGDIPYLDANKIKEGVIKPTYDTQKNIFEGLIAELKEVNTSLLAIETTGKGWKQGDILFKGSISKWRKFGNSIRLRLAMRMSNINPSLSATEAESAIADGVMDSNDDNAYVNFKGTGDPADAPLFSAYLTREDFTMSWQLTNLMKGNDDTAIGFSNPYNGILDPRLDVYALSADSLVSGVLTRTDGLPYGLTEAENAVVRGILVKDKRLVSYTKTAGKPTTGIPLILQPTFRVSFMDYANVALFIAESKGGDPISFEKGVEASLSMWGVEESKKASYIAAAMIKFNAADTEGKLELIITQKYIHNFAHTMSESWTEYRRTEYPKSLVRPGQQSGPELDGKTYLFTTEEASHGDRIIDRMKYPPAESISNKENLTSAIQSIGGDAQNLPLWWSKSYNK